MEQYVMFYYAMHVESMLSEIVLNRRGYLG